MVILGVLLLIINNPIKVDRLLSINKFCQIYGLIFNNLSTLIGLLTLRVYTTADGASGMTTGESSREPVLAPML